MNAHPLTGLNQPIEEKVLKLSDDDVVLVTQRLVARHIGTRWDSATSFMFDYMFKGSREYLIGWVRWYELAGIEFPEDFVFRGLFLR